jgi:acyl carrier protein
MNIEQFIQLVERQLGRHAVKEGDRFWEDLEAESIDMVHLAVAIEEEMGVEVPEAMMAGPLTVGELYRYVISRQT